MKLFRNINVRHFFNNPRDLRELDVYVDRMLARRKRISMLKTMTGTTVYVK